MYFPNLQKHDKETRIDFESSRTSDSSDADREIKKSSDGNKRSNLKSEVISDKSNSVPILSESDDEVNNQAINFAGRTEIEKTAKSNEQTKPIHMVIANKMTSLI